MPGRFSMKSSSDAVIPALEKETSGHCSKPSNFRGPPNGHVIDFPVDDCFAAARHNGIEHGDIFFVPLNFQKGELEEPDGCGDGDEPVPGMDRFDFDDLVNKCGVVVF